MVSINSNGNAWANWNAKNTSGNTATTPPATTTEPTAPAPMTAPSGETSSGAATVPSPIAAAPEPALVYSTPARTDIGQVSAPSHSLDGLLSEACFFSRSAAAGTSATAAAEPAASSAMPAALSQAEVVTRAAYAILAEAGADSATASLINQFG